MLASAILDSINNQQVCLCDDFELSENLKRFYAGKDAISNECNCCSKKYI